MTWDWPPIDGKPLHSEDMASNVTNYSESKYPNSLSGNAKTVLYGNAPKTRIPTIR
jgi:hypothetical protein